MTLWLCFGEEEKQERKVGWWELCHNVFVWCCSPFIITKEYELLYINMNLADIVEDKIVDFFF